MEERIREAHDVNCPCGENGVERGDEILIRWIVGSESRDACWIELPGKTTASRAVHGRRTGGPHSR